MATMDYTRSEEAWNAGTHAAGVVLATAVLAVLTTLSSVFGDAWSIVSCSIFGAAMFAAYFASSAYHLATTPKAKRILKKFDHIAIYYLIAGSYTPFMLVSIRGTLGWVVFSAIWSLALVGTFLKLYLPADGTKVWSIGLYLLMGWLVVCALGALFEALPTSGLVFLALGGVFYTSGAFFYMKKSWKYSHAIWHVFVLLGTLMHFFSVLFSCVFVD